VRDRRPNGQFRGYRKNCERVPSLPARIVARYLSDPRGTPYLLIWTDPDSGELKEAVRLAPFPLPAENAARPRWVEVKRWNGVRTSIRTMELPLPTGSKATLLFCDRCQTPRGALYAWEANKECRTLRSALWKCRRCSELSHTSEGRALVYRTRWAAARTLSGLKLWQRPEPWEPLVFTSPVEAFELGLRPERLLRPRAIRSCGETMSSNCKKKLEGSAEDNAIITRLETVLMTLKKQLRAKKKVYIRYKGIVTDVYEGPDHATQLRAVEELMKIMGLYL
jgi:hypothetical protein